MQINFEQAEKLFDNGFYDESFEIFATLASDKKYPLDFRAEAYNMMGVIISLAAPHLSDDEDESGLIFFKKSLQLDGQNFSAALNIIETYSHSK